MFLYYKLFMDFVIQTFISERNNFMFSICMNCLRKKNKYDIDFIIFVELKHVLYK